MTIGKDNYRENGLFMIYSINDNGLNTGFFYCKSYIFEEIEKGYILDNIKVKKWLYYKNYKDKPSLKIITYYL